MMEINKRNFLKSLLLSSLSIAFPIIVRGKEFRELLVSCYTYNDINYLCTLNKHGEVQNIIELNFRGHSMAYNKKKNEIIVFGRRPSQLASVVDLRFNKITTTISSKPERHFYGHGSITTDGKYLITTENDMKNLNGLVSIRDIEKNYEVINEYSSNGIGPHEILLTQNEKTIIVANGGIATHPSTGRKKLNIDNMDSNLSFIDIKNGNLINAFSLDDKYQSIRHICSNKNDDVFFSTQYEGQANTKIPLIGVNQNNKMIYFNSNETIIRKLLQYSGSIKFNDKDNFLAVTHPRGNKISIWDTKYKSFVKLLDLNDVCGISFNDGSLYATNGYGDLREYSYLGYEARYYPKFNGYKWDNHLELIKI